MRARLLDQPITYDSDQFVVVAADDGTSGLAFPRAPEHRAPTWPDPAVPQQIHLDVMVEDPAAAGADVVQPGATHLDGDIYADPAGHPSASSGVPPGPPRCPDGRRGQASGSSSP